MNMFLKCDATGCDHVEDAPDYSRELIGKPCPKCGESLLTEEDFNQFEYIRLLFIGLRELGLTTDTPEDGSVAVRVGKHKGKTTLEIEPGETSK